MVEAERPKTPLKPVSVEELEDEGFHLGAYPSYEAINESVDGYDDAPPQAGSNSSCAHVRDRDLFVDDSDRDDFPDSCSVVESHSGSETDKYSSVPGPKVYRSHQ